MGKRILVSGASGGIGHEISRQLLEKGAKVIGIGLYGKNAALEGSFHFYEVDLTNRGDVAGFADLLYRNGGVDAVVNAAGLYRMDFFPRIELDDYMQIIDVNVRGTVALYHNLLNGYMNSNKNVRKPAHFVDVISHAPFFVYGGDAVSAATKSAMATFSLGLAKEIEKLESMEDGRIGKLTRLRGIRFSRVYPDSVDTGIYEASRDNLVEAVDGFPKMHPSRVAEQVVRILFDDRYVGYDDISLTIEGKNITVRRHPIGKNRWPDFSGGTILA